MISEIFYEQANYNESIITDYLLDNSQPELRDLQSTSFSLLFFLNELRRSKAESLLPLFKESNKFYSIEYSYNRELYVHYWNEQGSYSFKRKTWGASTESLDSVSQDIPFFNEIKRRMNNEEELQQILDDVLKDKNSVHKKNMFLLSIFQQENDRLTSEKFAFRSF